MSRIVISVDMAYATDNKEEVVLKRVTNALQEDITGLYTDFCRKNNFDLTSKEHIENAAMPFIKQHENILP